MIPEPIQLLRRVERDLLQVQSEISDMKINTLDEPQRRLLHAAMLEVKRLRDFLDGLLLDHEDEVP